MIAADLTTDDIGAVLVIPIGEINVVGKLDAIGWPISMVRLVMDNDGVKTTIVTDRDKIITVTREHARFRAVTEADSELRGKWLHEVNHLGVMRLMGDVLGDAS